MAAAETAAVKATAAGMAAAETTAVKATTAGMTAVESAAGVACINATRVTTERGSPAVSANRRGYPHARRRITGMVTGTARAPR